MKAEFRKYRRIARISLQTALTYRANLLSGAILYALFLFVFFNLWRAIYADGSVEGLTLNQIIWYLCVTELISFGARTSVFREITNQVKSGEIAYQLIRPYRFIGFQLASAVGETVYKFVVFALLAVCVGLILAGPIEGLVWYTLPFSLLSLALGVALNFCCLLALGLSAFRLEENFGLYLIYSKLVFMLGTFIPLEFLPTWLREIARRLPFSYVSWGPARLTVGFRWELFFSVVPMQLIWLAVALGACSFLYRAGMKGIQGQGG